MESTSAGTPNKLPFVKTIVLALLSLSEVNLEAFLPHGSICPVDSGVSIPKKRTLTKRSLTSLSGVWKK